MINFILQHQLTQSQIKELYIRVDLSTSVYSSFFTLRQAHFATHYARA